MPAARIASDPLWQVLCPAWSRALPTSTTRLRPKRAQPQILSGPPGRPQSTIPVGQEHTRHDRSNTALPPIPGLEPVHNPLSIYYTHERTDRNARKRVPRDYRERSRANAHSLDPTQPESDRRGISLKAYTTPQLYTRAEVAASDGAYLEVESVVAELVRVRGEKPSVQLYTLLIAANVGAGEGAAWRAQGLLDAMRADGLVPDAGTCRAVLKVLSVHVDHLMRADVLEYMARRWFVLGTEGGEDVVAGLVREGCLEMAVERLDRMRTEGMSVSGWVWDLALYALVEAGEVGEATRIARMRLEETQAGSVAMSGSLWWFLLDRASDARHHGGTALAWSSQVTPGYLNPSAGVALNVLSTAAAAGDAALATSVFTHLHKTRTPFAPIHYQLLITTYLNGSPPDLNRALSILTLMPLENLHPTLAETRPLFLHFRTHPSDLPRAFILLRNLHASGRRIPIAALNVLIEAHTHHHNLPAALNLYKTLHTLAPLPSQQPASARKPFADIETFNLLLRGCRTASPPASDTASFLVAELLALRVRPTALTYDRLILVFVTAAEHAQGWEAANAGVRTITASASDKPAKSAAQLADFAFRHFEDMAALGWLPRAGTVELLAKLLAGAQDGRCWGLLQTAAEGGVEGWDRRGRRVRGAVEEAWRAAGDEGEAGGGDGGYDGGFGMIGEGGEVEGGRGHVAGGSG